MATIKSSLALYDGMTGPIQKIHNAMNTLIDAFENVQDISTNAVDTTSLQKARDLVADSITEWDHMADSVRGAGEAQDQFNGSIREGATAADALGGKLKGILATVGSIARVKSALGWVKENLELADTQRNAENQLKAVLANMGVKDIEIPVTTNAEEVVNSLNACADAVNTLDGSKVKGSVALDAEAALNTLDGYRGNLKALNGSSAATAVGLDAVNAWDNLTAYSEALDNLDGSRLSGYVALNTGAAMTNLFNYENNLEVLDGQNVTNTINANTSGAIKALNQYNRAANALNGSKVQTVLNFDTGEAISAAMEYDDWANQTDGRTIQTSLVLNEPDKITPPTLNPLILDTPNDVEINMDLKTGGAVAAYNDFVNAVDGNTITTTVTVDTTQTMSAFDAITAKASEIQGRGVYGDEIMIAGAAELATYFSDAEAIISMMDTLSNYAMGMSATEGNGLGLDSAAIVQYATNLGKIMTGTYTAMSQKGFEFTDAQKAIIEGTATQAQIVEALGVEYLDCSADMQAAAAINSVIGEAWDGLYDAMSNTPEGKIEQFNNTLGDVREVLGNQLYPAALHFFDVFTQKFPQIETVLTGFTAGLSTLITVLTWIAALGLDVATVFAENWGWIGPIIGGVAAALAVYNGYLLVSNTLEAISNGLKAVAAARSALHAGMTLAQAAATTTATGATVGLNAALLACPIPGLWWALSPL